MTRSRSRAWISVAMALAAVLVTAGCSSVEGTSPSGNVSAEVPDGFETYFTQDVEWSDCDGGFECATIQAPIDWDDPSSDATELALVKHPATDGDAIGSLFYNPGGPGASGVTYVQGYLESLFGADLIEEYDIVGFDPRGVGKSAGITCLDSDAMDDFLYGLPEHEPGTAAYDEEMRENFAEFGDACLANSGDLVKHMDTDSVVKDLELMRQLVDGKQLNYLGASYGTNIGAQYADAYPQNVGRMVLDGVLDPSLDMYDLTLGQMKGFDGVGEAYFKDCLENDDACPFEGSVDDAIDQYLQLLDDLSETPLTATDGRKLGEDSMVTATVLAFYSPSYWSSLTDAFNDIYEDDDPDAAFDLADVYNDRVEGVYTSNQTEAFYATECLDYATFTDEQLETYRTEAKASSKIFGEYYAQGAPMCDGWPVAATGEPATVTAKGANPILLVGTTGDPATPYEWAESVADQLDDATLLTYEGDVHTAYSPYGSVCVADAVEGYLLTGQMPEDGTTCSS